MGRKTGIFLSIALTVLVLSMVMLLWVALERKPLDVPDLPGLNGKRTDTSQPSIVSRIKEKPYDQEMRDRESLDPAKMRLEIRGRFLNTNAEPLKRVRVEIEYQGECYKTKSEKDGAFSSKLEVNAFQYFEGRFFACKDGYADYVQEIVCEPSKVLDLGSIVLERGGTISGLVRDKQGRPVADAEVFYTKNATPMPGIPHVIWRHFGPSLERYGETRTAVDGTFKIKGVPPGTVRVWAAGKTTIYDFTLTPLLILPGKEFDNLRLSLVPLPTSDRIEGVVLSPGGKPVPRARVALFGGRSASRKKWSEPDRIVEADERGRFFCRTLLLIHHYDLEAKDPLGRYAPKRVEGIRRGTLDLVIRLDPKE
ncbi:MAG: carboxypeptidase-like regulatory domain-containing protein [Planctomycetota bacterium]|jgi:hypothetical protein